MTRVLCVTDRREDIDRGEERPREDGGRDWRQAATKNANSQGDPTGILISDFRPLKPGRNKFLLF